MNLKTLKTPNMRRAKRYRKGRGPGSGNGKMAGRGQNGYYSRSGASRKIGFEGGQMQIWRRVPKRGFNNYRYATRFAVINVADLNAFEPDTEVTWEVLQQVGLVPGRMGTWKYFGVKVLGEGEIDRKLTVHAHKFSKSAQSKLEAAGCKVVTLEGRYKTGTPKTEDSGKTDDSGTADTPKTEASEGPSGDS